MSISTRRARREALAHLTCQPLGMGERPQFSRRDATVTPDCTRSDGQQPGGPVPADQGRHLHTGPDRRHPGLVRGAEGARPDQLISISFKHLPTPDRRPINPHFPGRVSRRGAGPMKSGRKWSGKSRGVSGTAAGAGATRSPDIGVDRMAEKRMYTGHPDRGSEQPVLLGIHRVNRRKFRGVFGPGTVGEWTWERPGPWRPHGCSAPPPWPIRTER